MGARANVCEHVCFDGVRDGVSQRVRGRKRRRRKENGEWRGRGMERVEVFMYVPAYIHTCIHTTIHARNSHPPTDNFRAVNDRYVFPRHPVPNRQLVVVQLCACAGVIFHILNIVV